MIAKLRTRHRRLWWTLALVLPATLVLALWTRRPAVMMDKLPPGLADGVAGGPADGSASGSASGSTGGLTKEAKP